MVFASQELLGSLNEMGVGISIQLVFYKGCRNAYHVLFMAQALVHQVPGVPGFKFALIADLCVTQGKWLHFSDPQFPPLQNRINNSRDFCQVSGTMSSKT